MEGKIDYLAIERKSHKEGSFNAALKQLVTAIRHVQEMIPATEIKNHMASLYALEEKVQNIDKAFGEPKREYLQEIWELFKTSLSQTIRNILLFVK